MRIPVMAIAGALVPALAFAGNAPPGGDIPSRSVRRIEARKVCMANDKLFEKTADKATAVIGARPDGEVFNFENEKNMAAFDRKPSDP